MDFVPSVLWLYNDSRKYISENPFTYFFFLTKKERIFKIRSVPEKGAVFFH